jgi:transcriptional regulator with XRE-family HTH domain
MEQAIATRNLMREIRIAHDLSQAEMAAKLGCSIPSVKRLEGAGTLPKNAAVMRNLKALGTLANIEVESEAVTP